MDQASPEGSVLPSASVPTQAPAQNIAEPPKVETPAESQPAKVDEQPKEPKGVGKRIDELTRLRRDAERDRDYWRELAMRSQQQPQTQAQPVEQEKTLKDFNYDDAAFMRYASERIKASADKEAKAAAERYRAEQDAITRRAKFDERIDAFARSVEDYDEVVTKETPVSEPMADFLMDSDEAGALMYYLGNNRDEAAKLYRLSPAKAGRELQKLEDRLVAERKKAAEKPVTKAPEPPPKIEAAEASLNVAASSPESDKLDMKTWLKRREKEIAKNRG